MKNIFAIVLIIIFAAILGLSLWGARRHYIGWARGIAIMFISILALVIVCSQLALGLTNDAIYQCVFQKLTIIIPGGIVNTTDTAIQPAGR